MRLVSLFRRCCAFEPDERPSMVSVEAELVSMVAEIVDSASGALGARKHSNAAVQQPRIVTSRRQAAATLSRSPPTSNPSLSQSPKPESAHMATTPPAAASALSARFVGVLPLSEVLERDRSHSVAASARETSASAPSSPRSNLRKTPSFSMMPMLRRGKPATSPVDEPATLVASPGASHSQPSSPRARGQRRHGSRLAEREEAAECDTDADSSTGGAESAPVSPRESRRGSKIMFLAQEAAKLPRSSPISLPRMLGQLRLNLSSSARSPDSDATVHSAGSSPGNITPTSDATESPGPTPRRHRRSNSDSTLSSPRTEPPKKAHSSPAPGKPTGFLAFFAEEDIQELNAQLGKKPATRR